MKDSCISFEFVNKHILFVQKYFGHYNLLDVKNRDSIFDQRFRE